MDREKERTPVELPESAYPPFRGLAPSSRAVIRVPSGQEGQIHPHSNVQAYADALMAATGADSFGTYLGHEPTADLALDTFVPVSSRVLGDAICAFALPNIDRFGIDYVIYRQRIYNPEIATYWRNMGDRGSPTANHFDHVHVSFNDVPAPAPVPDPVPPPTPPEDVMASPFVLLSYGSGVALWHPSGDVVPLASSKQVNDALTRGDVVMDDLTEEQISRIVGAEHALAASNPELADELTRLTSGD